MKKPVTPGARRQLNYTACHRCWTSNVINISWAKQSLHCLIIFTYIWLPGRVINNRPVGGLPSPAPFPPPIYSRARYYSSVLSRSHENTWPDRAHRATNQHKYLTKRRCYWLVLMNHRRFCNALIFQQMFITSHWVLTVGHLSKDCVPMHRSVSLRISHIPRSSSRSNASQRDLSLSRHFRRFRNAANFPVNVFNEWPTFSTVTCVSKDRVCMFYLYVLWRRRGFARSPRGK